jgi:hypothetical protein
MLVSRRTTRQRSTKSLPRASLKLPKDSPGIREVVLVEARHLKNCVNPLNWKNHTPRQQRALRASMAKHGWAGVTLYNETTGHLIDGHGRLEDLKPGEPAWVAIGRWTPEQERSLLATLDPIGAMAETDPAALRRLTDQIHKDQQTVNKLAIEHQQTFLDLTTQLEERAELIEFGENPSFFPEEEYEDEGKDKDKDKDEDEDEDGEKPEQDKGGSPSRRKTQSSAATSAFGLSSETESISQFKPRQEIAVASWNPVAPFDIPSLRFDRLGQIPRNISPWIPADKSHNYHARKTDQNQFRLYIWGLGTIGIDWSSTVVCFYTADRRFESCWNNPNTFTAKLSNARPYCLIAPNFSIWEGTSRAEEIYQIYRTRFVARYWQEAGFDVVPDIQLGNLWGTEAWQWRFLGLPVGLPAISVNLQTPGTSKQIGKSYLNQFFSSRKNRLLSALKILKPEQLFLYHGTRLPDSFLKALPKQLDVVTCQSHMSEVISRRQDKDGKQT